MKRTRTVIIQEEIETPPPKKNRIGIIIGIVAVVAVLAFLSNSPENPPDTAPETSIPAGTATLGNQSALIGELSAKLAQDPENNDIRFQMGNLLLAARRDREALACLKPLAARDSANAAAHNAIGVAHARLGEHDRAIEAYTRALSLRPEFPEAQFNLGTAYMDKGNSAEAMACFQKTIDLDNTFLGAYNNLAGLYARNGDVEQAIGLYEAALKIDRGYTDAHRNLASIYSFLGDSTRAQEHLRASAPPAP